MQHSPSRDSPLPTFITVLIKTHLLTLSANNSFNIPIRMIGTPMAVGGKMHLSNTVIILYIHACINQFHNKYAVIMQLFSYCNAVINTVLHLIECISVKAPSLDPKGFFHYSTDIRSDFLHGPRDYSTSIR